MKYSLQLETNLHVLRKLNRAQYKAYCRAWRKLRREAMAGMNEINASIKIDPYKGRKWPDILRAHTYMQFRGAGDFLWLRERLMIKGE